MDRLWSPWRSEYVSNANARDGDDERSLFTRLHEAEDDADSLILWRGERVFVLLNAHPYNNGHLMVVPYREVDAYDALTAAEQGEMAAAIDRCIRWLRAAMAPDGFNVGMNQGRAAGAGIPEHLHLHVVPRWNGDTNFTTTTAHTRVIPEDLATTYRKLRAVVDADPAPSQASGDA